MRTNRRSILLAIVASVPGLCPPAVRGQDRTWERLDGGPILQDVDGPRAVARVGFASGIAPAPDGAFYLTGTWLRRVEPSGDVTTLAGDGYGVPSDGIGAGALFNRYSRAVVDAQGNILVADGHAIRRVTPAGVVTTLAGSLERSHQEVDGVGAAARFTEMRDIAIDPSGILYTLGAGTLRRILPDGTVTTIAGRFGASGTADGPGSDARFSNSSACVVDAAGIVYVLDGAWTIRRVDRSGFVTTPGYFPYSVSSLAADPDGTLYALAGSRVLRRAVDGNISVLVEGWRFGDGIGADAGFEAPRGLVRAPSGDLWLLDSGTLRRVAPDGRVSTLVGQPPVDLRPRTDGPIESVRITVASLTGGEREDLYFIDGYAVRKLSNGWVSTIAGSVEEPGAFDGPPGHSLLLEPRSIARSPSGELWVADAADNTLRRISLAGEVETVVGAHGIQGDVDGPVSEARLSYPRHVAVDPSGDAWVVDGKGLRRVAASGEVTTVLQRGISRVPGSPMAVDRQGILWWVDDYGQRLVRMARGAPPVPTGGFPDREFTDNGGVAISPRDGMMFAMTDYGGWMATWTPGGVLRRDETAPPTSNYGVELAADGAGNVYARGGGLWIGRPAIPDRAVVDVPRGSVGVTRRLGVSPRTATTFAWRPVRIPTGSRATLSSTTAPDPTFTPDVADRFVFELVARGPLGASISRVAIDAGCAPRIVSVAAAPPSCEEAVLTVAAEGATSYQWNDGFDIPGAVAPEVRVSKCSYYTCRAINSCGVAVSPPVYACPPRFAPQSGLPPLQLLLTHDGGGAKAHWVDRPLYRYTSYRVLRSTSREGPFTDLAATADTGFWGVRVPSSADLTFYRLVPENACGVGEP